MAINVARVRALLQSFELQRLFVEELGWNNPANARPVAWEVGGTAVRRREIATLAGVTVFEVTTGGGIPNESLRRAIANEVAELHREHLLIFLDDEARRTSSLWYWLKREGGKTFPRRHTFVAGQSGELLISKLSAMFVDIGELDDAGDLRLVEAVGRLRRALDIEPVTRKFFDSFKELHGTLLNAIGGIADEGERRWYASVLLNRLMFIYFLQRKGFLDGGDRLYLQNRLEQVQGEGEDHFYGTFLQALFFEGFARPGEQRSPAARALIGDIRYLNGGLFLPHQVEQQNRAITIPDAVFARILKLFADYDWNLDDTPGGDDDEINPAVLGYIFEKYINQKAFGAYYTRAEITEYLCEQTIHRLILDKVNETLTPPARPFESVGDLLLGATAPICRLLLLKVLPELRLIDPACGSGAFLVAAMRTLIEVYSGLIGKAKFTRDATLTGWLREIEREHPNIDYFIKKQIITNNLFGVDIMAEATEIARLRLFLALVASAQRVEDLEPLPNIDFNILAGNALIGLLQVDEGRAEQQVARQQAQQLGLFDDAKRDSYREIVAEKNRLVASYRNTAQQLKVEDLGALRDAIQRHRERAADLLDAMLLEDFQTLKIRYEQATWDVAKGKEGKPQRRPLTIDDIRALQPFHWGYEFDQVMHERGGFDAIITNPPWEVFQTDEKEFFRAYEDTVFKKKLRLENWKQQQAELMLDPVLQQAWLGYVSSYPHVTAFLKAAPQYQNQTSLMNGRNVGSKVNLYSYFVEQCFNLLRDGGQCGIVLPSGIYTDVGTKQLRDMLFTQGQVRSMLTLSNERFLFEGVHHSFKFCFLIFEKGGVTQAFEAAFRINPREAVGTNTLEGFLAESGQHLSIPIELIRRLSPDTLSVMEFRSSIDIIIAEKLLLFPLLDQKIPDTWNVELTSEFNITSDHTLFETELGPRRLSLFTGKMFNQFMLTKEHSGYWIDEAVGRKALLGKIPDTGQRMDYQGYRWVHRRIARNTDTRTFITTIAPPMVFTEVNSTTLIVGRTGITNAQQLFFCAFSNSLVLDWMLRQKVAATLNMFYIYQLPVPRLTERDAAFAPIVERAAKLICTTAEYDELAREVGLGDHTAGVTDPMERAQLRAELDALVAHLYGLSEAELTHMLASFPLVEQAQKDAVLNEFRRRAANPDDVQVAALIAAGESDRVEFKVAAYWNAKTGQKDGSMRNNIVQAVAAFLNSREGGVVLIGVENATNKVVGLSEDYKAANEQKQDRDGYELALRDAIGNSLAHPVGTLLTFAFHSIGGQEVCRITVRPSPEPVYLSGDLYVRIGNAKKKLSAQQAVGYIEQRWGN